MPILVDLHLSKLKVSMSSNKLMTKVISLVYTLSKYLGPVCVQEFEKLPLINLLLLYLCSPTFVFHNTTVDISLADLLI